MDTIPVHKYKQNGSSLIELLIASFIGIIAISLVGSIFINGQRVAKNRGLELLLAQNLTSTMQIIKEDIQRAGYDGADGQSVKLSAAANIIEITPNSIAFVYHRYGLSVNSNIVKTYQNIIYIYSPSEHSLKICEQETFMTDIKTMDTIDECDNLFDDNNIKVTAFNVTKTPLITSSATSSIIDIQLDIELVNIPTMKKGLSFNVKQRNWL
ncbi:PilW family protein [Aliivibrio salmonicida]|uniref:PilW family protein n=1 Tax=Aliivibrio salmonicida TaxID=40269 RepID=UPI003D0DEA11